MDPLAARYVEARTTIAQAARALHDDIAPLLGGTGIFLSLIKADFPKAAGPAEEALTALNNAMESVRALGQRLSSPTERLGLREALVQVAEQDLRIQLSYTATARLTRETAAALYEIAMEAVAAANAAKAERIRLRITGTSKITIRVTDNGSVSVRKRSTFLKFASVLAKNSGIILQISGKKSTIVCIIYADRRALGRRP